MVQMRPTTALLFALILLCTLSGPTHCAVADQHLPIKGEGLLDRRTAPFFESPSQVLPGDSSQSYPENSSQSYPEDSSRSYPEDSSHPHHEDSSHAHHGDSSHAHHEDSSHAHHGDSSHAHHEDSSHGSPDVPKPTILKYDDNLSLKALRYSKAAHCSIEELKKCKHGHACDVFPSFELHRVRRDDFHESLCYTGVQHNDKRIVVAFHANFTLLGVIEDLLLDKVPYHNKACGSNCKVHANTYIAYQYLRKNIVKDVLRLRRAHPDYSLLVTAHSLGGALATLCAVDLAAFPTVDHGSKLQDVSLLESSQYQRRHHGFGTHKLTPTHLYTFGQPRVGNPDFARWASSVLSKTSTFRVTHGRDPVPHLPPGFLDYIHLPHEVWYGNPENPDAYRLCVDSPTAEDRKCSASLLPISVSDHLYYLGLFMGCDTVELMDNSDTNLEALNSYAKFNKDHYSYFEHNE